MDTCDATTSPVPCASLEVQFRHDSDGALVIEARLPPETGEIVLKALAAAGETMYVRRKECDAARQAARKNSAEFAPGKAWRRRKSCNGILIDGNLLV